MIARLFFHTSIRTVHYYRIRVRASIDKVALFVMLTCQVNRMVTALVSSMINDPTVIIINQISISSDNSQVDRREELMFVQRQRPFRSHILKFQAVQRYPSQSLTTPRAKRSELTLPRTYDTGAPGTRAGIEDRALQINGTVMP